MTTTFTIEYNVSPEFAHELPAKTTLPTPHEAATIGQPLLHDIVEIAPGHPWIVFGRRWIYAPQPRLVLYIQPVRNADTTPPTPGQPLP